MSAWKHPELGLLADSTGLKCCERFLKQPALPPIFSSATAETASSNLRKRFVDAYHFQSTSGLYMYYLCSSCLSLSRSALHVVIFACIGLFNSVACLLYLLPLSSLLLTHQLRTNFNGCISSIKHPGFYCFWRALTQHLLESCIFFQHVQMCTLHLTHS